MANPPYKLVPTPTQSVNAGTQLRSPAKAEVFRHAITEGETLYEAATEQTAPDHEIGTGAPKEAGTNRGEDHVQQPSYPPAIPWPAAPGVARSPMKLKQ
jgi:hypothetical protein